MGCSSVPTDFAHAALTAHLRLQFLFVLIIPEPLALRLARNLDREPLVNPLHLGPDNLAHPLHPPPSPYRCREGEGRSNAEREEDDGARIGGEWVGEEDLGEGCQGGEGRQGDE